MRSEFRWGPLTLVALCGSAGVATAQIPYTVFDESTEVRSVRFVFPDSRSFEAAELERAIALRGRGALHAIRNALSWLPLVPDPAAHQFEPLELQYDVARLRQFYAEAGFLDTDVRYEVHYRADDNVVDVDLIILEGRPVMVRSIEVAGADQSDLGSRLPEEMRREWETLRTRVEADTGQRFTEQSRLRHDRDLLNWWKNRGWAYARVRTDPHIDTTAATATLRVTLAPGPRARIGTIAIEGGESVSRDVILRGLPFKEGDWFSGDKLAEGQRRLFAMDLFRVALVDLVPDSPPDTVAHIRVRIRESRLRLITGELGYASGAGITASGEFTHRNFLGGARSLTLSALGETGVLGTNDIPNREFRGALTFRQPWFLHPRATLLVSPFYTYRDDVTDRSWQYGLETSVLYQLGPNRALSLTHRYSSRRVLDYRFGTGNSIDFETLLELLALGVLDSTGQTIDRSTLGLTGIIGRYDPTRLSNALQGRPTIEVTVPSGLNTIEYASLDVPILAYRKLRSGVALSGRLRAGRVFPFGKTTQGMPSLLDQIELRDVLLTAGGTASVRGWGEGLLGPKFVNLVFTPTGNADTLLLSANGYAPVGGLQRVAGSLEIQLPIPGLGPQWGTHVFLDGGRVWTTDERFAGEDLYDEQRWFFGAGAGFQVQTIVGPVRFSAGWKLNPSPLDLRDPDAVLGALLTDRPVSSVPTDWKHRLHLHLSLGHVF
jgi:outer membrane protein insertion porin family